VYEVEDQAFKFLAIQAKNEWHGRSRQQECQKDYSENDNHV
jgi:hypothetical protein